MHRLGILLAFLAARAARVNLLFGSSLGVKALICLILDPDEVHVELLGELVFLDVLFEEHLTLGSAVRLALLDAGLILLVVLEERVLDALAAVHLGPGTVEVG